jgi:dissimilatory sulfite reductase (desulfoviridin) alpha/beta subunit
MVWSEEAENAVARVPFFVRKRVRKEVESEASRRGSNQVSLDHVNACRARFLSGKDMQIKGFQIETCFGSGGCENRAMASNQLVDGLEKLLGRRNFADFLKKQVQGQVKFHHELRISVSDCPNACSRPQIVDIGIIGACRPGVSDEQCAGCGACTDACREGAISLVDGAEAPILDAGKCVACGKCLDACPSGTLVEEVKGWRILLGGKLGRHPQLGRELEGIYSAEQVLAIVERCLDLYFTHNIAGERLGTILNRIGYPA